MIKLHCEKLYRHPRIKEHMTVAVPFKKGQVTNTESVQIFDGDNPVPLQCKVTAKHDDGSVKYLFVRFQGDLPGNGDKDFYLDWQGKKKNCFDAETSLKVDSLKDGFKVENGNLYFEVRDSSERLLESFFDGKQLYERDRFEGPYLELLEDEQVLPVCKMSFGKWSVSEAGPLCVILKTNGLHNTHDGRNIRFEVKVTAWAGKPWVEISYRLINSSLKELSIGAMGFYCKSKNDSIVTSEKKETTAEKKVTGIVELAEVENLYSVSENRYCTGYSNYKTKFTLGKGTDVALEEITTQRLLMESNEHMAEVLYGTFFADRTDEKGGICATIYQAQQNYPKAVWADEDGIGVMLVPRGEERIVMQPGMSREQKFLLHFHGSDEPLAELDNRSLIYQMPDRPVVSPEVFKESGVMTDVFPGKKNVDTEIMLTRRADSHNRGFGMLNWGDSIDRNYTNQGRGGGKPVWTNNEYDYVHACALMYARTGIRRFLDYMLVSASHWMDVDICHYSEDPLRIGAQIEHTVGHVINGKVLPSHEWVEGLLDYYHFTGDERGLESALGIGENVLRQLDTPAFSKAGELSARETGWALRTLTALYVETGDEKWLEKGEWIIGHFREWEQEYGHWLSPYTDNTLIRVPFMISVAVGSVMRYYRVRPSEEVKGMILRAVDDLVENCMLETGGFFYKELPSLMRLIDNPLPLEAMAIGYELTGDKKYLEAGKVTFDRILREVLSKGGEKQHLGDAVIIPGEGTKLFGQGFIPLATYDRALEAAGMRN